MTRDHASKQHVLPYFLLVITMLCWAGNFTLARAVRADIAPISLAFWRWVMAVLFLVPFSYRHVRQDWNTIRANLGILSLLGFLGITCYNTLIYIAVRSTTAINGSLFTAAMPAIMAVLTWLIFRQGVSFKQFVGITLCIAGALLVLLRGSLGTLAHLAFARGDVLVLLAVTLHCLYSVLLRFGPAVHQLSFLTATFSFGILFLSPFYLMETVPTVWNEQAYLSVLYTAIFPSIVAYIGWNRGVRALGANAAGLFLCLISVFTGILSVLFLEDPLRWYHFVSLLAIFTGMLIFNLGAATQLPSSK